MPAEALYWVPGLGAYRLALMARPRGGEWLRDEIRYWHNAHVKTVVSCLTKEEVSDLVLGEEPALCAEFGIRFRAFPIADRGTPTSGRDFAILLHELQAALELGQGVAIHCRAGIGRSGLVAGCLLHKLGIPFAEIFPRLTQARGVVVPDTAAQIAWVRQFTEI